MAHVEVLGATYLALYIRGMAPYISVNNRAMGPIIKAPDQNNFYEII